MKTSRQIGGLLGWLALTFLAAVLAGMASVEAGSFYRELALPAWAPPAWLFGPVWTVLYAMMGVAAWLVWREKGFSRARGALGVYLLQLGMNTLWSWLFFAWKLGGPALVDILNLLILIAIMVVAFWRVRPLAGAMIMPYLLWVAFAAWLNYTVWQMNPTLLG